MARAQRLSLLLTLFCALFLRVAIPIGWMPAAHGGAFAIEPCPAADAQKMPMHVAGKHSPQKDQHGGDCSFSPVHVGFTSADDLAGVPAVLAADASPRILASSSFRATGPPALPPPSTGPPLHA